MRDENSVPLPRVHGDGIELCLEQSHAGSKRAREEEVDRKASRANGNSFAFGGDDEHRVATLGDSRALSARNDNVLAARIGAAGEFIAPERVCEGARGIEEENATKRNDDGNLVRDEDDGFDENDVEFYLTQLDGGGGGAEGDVAFAGGDEEEEREEEQGALDAAGAAAEAGDEEKEGGDNNETENGDSDAFCPVCSTWLPGICGTLLGRQAHVNACLDGTVAGGDEGEREEEGGPRCSPQPVLLPSSPLLAATAAAAAPRGLITSYLPGGEQARQKKLILSMQKQQQRPLLLPPWKAPLPRSTGTPLLLVDCYCPSSLASLDSGSSFRVLTHFSPDHSAGPTSRARSEGPRIICTPGTAALASLGLGRGGGGTKTERPAPKVPRDRFLPLPLDTPMLLLAPESEKREAKVGWTYQLTLVDARHCPGSAMAVVEAVFPTGDDQGRQATPSSPLPPPLLHTGGFRWEREAMARSEALRRIRGVPGLTLVLDTTSLRSPPSDSGPVARVSFPPRQQAVEFATRAVAAEAFRGQGKTLFLFGSSRVGKDELALGVASRLGKKVWAPPSRRRGWSALREAGALGEELFETVVTDEELERMNVGSGGGGSGEAGARSCPRSDGSETGTAPSSPPPPVLADIHVVPMSCATLKGAERILSHFRARGSNNKASSFEAAVVFRPSGCSVRPTWATATTTAAKQKQQRTAKADSAPSSSLRVKRTVRGRVLLYDLPYSEHSSFEELVDCVRWLRPTKIVPSVGARFVRSDGGGGREEEGDGLCETGKGMIRALREAVAAADAEGEGEEEEDRVNK